MAGFGRLRNAKGQFISYGANRNPLTFAKGGGGAGGLRIPLTLDSSGFTIGLQQAAAALKSFERGINGSLGKLKSSFTMIPKLAKYAAVTLGVAFVSAVYKLTAAFNEFDRAMFKSLAIMGDVSEVMKKDMRNAAIEVAKSTNYSAAEAAEAFFFLSSAGYDAAESLKVMPTVAKFAQAGYLQMSEATNILADSMSALGLRTHDAQQDMVNMTRVSDVLSKANIIANGEIQDFALALQNKAAAALRLVNKDVEEGVAVLAAFADQGIKGEEAGTALGIVMRDMQTKALKHADAFKRAGVEVYSATGKMKNMADIVEDLEQRLDGMSDAAKKAELLKMGFSDRSVAFTQSLLGTSDRIREYEKELRNAGGTTDEIAGKMMTDLDKALNMFKGSVQELAEKMAPAVKMMAEYIKGLSLLRLERDKDGRWTSESVVGAEASYSTGAIAQEAGSWGEFAQTQHTEKEINAFNMKKMLQGDFSGSDAYQRMMGEHEGAMTDADARTAAGGDKGMLEQGYDMFRAGVNKTYNMAGRVPEYISNQQTQEFNAREEQRKEDKKKAKGDESAMGSIKSGVMGSSFLGNTLAGFGLDSLDKITEKAGSALRSAGDFANGIPGAINRFSQEQGIGKYYKGNEEGNRDVKTVRAQDTLSREGNAQRVRSGMQERGKGVLDQQLVQQKESRKSLRTIERVLQNSSVVLAQANIA